MKTVSAQFWTAEGSIQDTLLIAGDATASKKTLVFNIVHNMCIS